MLARQIEATIAGKKLLLEEPTVGAIESLARDFNGNLQDRLAYKRFMRDMAAVAISSIDGKPIDQEKFDARAEFPKLKDWNRLQAAYNVLMKVDEVAKSIDQAKARLRQNDGENCELLLPSGMKVVLAALTVEQDEELEMKGKYANNDLLRSLHDKIQLAIVELEGQKVDHSTFNARVSLPYYGDWQLLSAVYNLMTQEEEDVDAFLKGVLG